MASAQVGYCMAVFGLVTSAAIGQMCPLGAQLLQRPSSGASELLGSDVAASGPVIAAAAPGLFESGYLRGQVLVFERGVSGAWTLAATLRVPTTGSGSTAEFGAAVDTDGSRIAVGNPHDFNAAGAWAGAVYIFRRESAGDWVLEQRLVNPGPDTAGNFGRAVAIAGDRLFVGPTTTADPGLPRAVAHYTRDVATNVWTLRQMITPTGVPSAQTPGFGTSVATAQGRVCIGSPIDFETSTSISRGAVYIFDLQPQGTYVQSARILGPTPVNPGSVFGDYFGEKVAFNGSVFLASAPMRRAQGVSSGAAYVYEQNGGASSTWTLAATFLPDDPSRATGFARDVALRGTFAVVGEPNRQIGFEIGTSTGVANVYERTGEASWLNRGIRSTRPVGTFFPDAQRGLASAVAITLDDVGEPHLVLGAPETIGGLENAGSVDVLALQRSIIDCNANGVDDACEVSRGFARDLNGNGIPDTCCPIDIDGSRVVNTQDIFAFINAFFVRAPIADFNRSGSITTLDVFDFLNAWFQQGC